jgi:large subunit ribosomal protein L17
MRHRVAGKKLNRTSSHRKALAKNLMRAFVIEWQVKGHIVTTRTKAKFIQPKIEKLISLSRNKTVHNIRRAMSLIGDRAVVQVLFDEIGPYYSDRPGGYTRVLRLVKPRLGDATVQAYLGYVREDDDYPEGDRRSRSSTSESAVVEEASTEAAAAVEDSAESSDEPVAEIAEEAAGDGETSSEEASEGDEAEETPK